jgi:hypothetical protein
MALIEYRIVVDANGQATVLQDIREIGPGDRIQFVADAGNAKDTYIQFDTASPFANPGSKPTIIGVPKQPQAYDPHNPPPSLKIVDAAGGQTEIQQPLKDPKINAGNHDLALLFDQTFRENRRSYHFQCGQLVDGEFVPWGGLGLRTPSGGTPT